MNRALICFLVVIILSTCKPAGPGENGEYFVNDIEVYLQTDINKSEFIQNVSEIGMTAQEWHNPKFHYDWDSLKYKIEFQCLNTNVIAYCNWIENGQTPNKIEIFCYWVDHRNGLSYDLDLYDERRTQFHDCFKSALRQANLIN